MAATNLTVIKLGLSASSLTDYSNAWRDVRNPVSGLTAEKGGSVTWVEHESLGHKSHTVAIIFDDATPALRTFLEPNVLEEIFYEYGPDGSASGKRKITGSFIYDSFDPSNQRATQRTLTIGGPGNGARVVGTY